MPTRAPELEGPLVAAIKRDTVAVKTDWAEWVLRILSFPFIAMTAMNKLTAMNASNQRMQNIYKLRIETGASTIREARIEGYLDGSEPALSEYVALWGKDDRGMLVVERGYNWTTGAEIHFRPAHNPWLARGAVIALTLTIAIISMALPGFLPGVIGLVIAIPIAAFIGFFIVRAMLPWLPASLARILVMMLVALAALGYLAHLLTR